MPSEGGNTKRGRMTIDTGPHRRQVVRGLHDWPRRIQKSGQRIEPGENLSTEQEKVTRGRGKGSRRRSL